jgi:phage terminase large subunit GpA-like protein
MTADLDERLAAPEIEARHFLAGMFMPPPPVDLVKWGERSIIFGPDAPFPGPLDMSKFPFWLRPLKCLQPDDPCKFVAIMKSAQVGGTVVGDVFVGGYADLDPAPILVTHPSIDQGRLWLKNKFRAHIRNSPVLRAIFPMGPSRDAKSTETYLERRDQRGFIQVGGANSSASLSQHTIKRQVQDDLAKWENNENGDPEQQADTRSSAYAFDAKILKISTPTIHGVCRITRNYEQGTQEQLHILCPACAHSHPLEWESMRTNIEAAIASKSADETIFVAAMRGAHFNCPACGTVIGEHQRDSLIAEAAMTDRWVAGNPGAHTRSFYIWSAMSRLKRWAEIALEYVKARGLPEKEQVFLNDWVGIAYKVDCETPEWTTLRDRAALAGHQRGKIPAGYYLLAAGVDCQADRIEVGVWAFGPDRRRAVIDHTVLPGAISQEETKKILSTYMATHAWQDSYGNQRFIEALAIDAGYETEHVTDWVARMGREKVMAVRGHPSDNAPSIGLADTTRITTKAKRVKKRSVVYWVGQSILKMWLYADLKKEDPLERNSIALARGFDDAWFVQLTAEQRRRTKNKRGYEIPQWVLPAGTRNEVLDCAVYAHAAAEHLLGWKRLTEEHWARISIERDVRAQASQLDLLSPEVMIVPAPPASDKTSSDQVAEEKPAMAPRKKRDDWLTGYQG